MNKKNSSSGFTLLELVIYTGIFASVAGLLTSILVSTTKVTTNQTVTTQVSNELNLLLSTVQNQVRSSSNIDCVGSSQSTCSTSTSPGSYLKLRFENPALDPTCIYLSGTQILLAQGPDSTNPQNCTSVTQAITTGKVNATSLTFTKYDFPGGHATVQVDATLAYNSTSPDMQISRSLHSAIGRVSAATFDSDLLPDLTNSRSIGTSIGPKTWKDLFLSGNLGIGTTAPAAKLQINGGGVGLPPTTGTAVSAGEVMRLRSTDAAGGILDIGSGTNQFWFQSTDATGLGTGYQLLLNPNGGNVGIGTTTPTSKLQVVGQIRADSPDGSDALSLYNSANGGFWNVNLKGDATTSNNFYLNNTNLGIGMAGNTLTIRSNGNVGIGTTTPNAKLDVTNAVITADTQLGVFGAPGSLAGVGYVTFGGGFVGWDYASGGIALNAHSAGGSNGGIFVKGLNAGASVVGIGTKTPGTRLHIKQSADSAIGGIRLERNVDTNSWEMWNSSAAYLTFSYNTSPVMTLANNGSVGIGTAGPTHTLGVAGTIGASGAITASTTPDLSETIQAAPDVIAADVVMADPNNTERVIKSDKAYESAVVGVISDGTSSFMINSYGGSESATLTGKPLVLAGRVPVHVTNEGGAIKPGDYLTTSNTPGYAMKATHAGPTIGKSYGFFDGRSGKVLTMVNVSYYDPNNGQSTQDARIVALEAKVVQLEKSCVLK